MEPILKNFEFIPSTKKNQEILSKSESGQVYKIYDKNDTPYAVKTFNKKIDQARLKRIKKVNHPFIA